MARDFDLVIRGGTVVTAADRFTCDVGVRAGRIVALAEGLGPATREIDAKGRLVLPGGIDSHCHLDQLSGSGVYTADTFRSGSISAAHGGTTTIVPFMPHRRGQTLRDALADYHAKAEDRSLLDYGFHLIIAEASETVLGEMPALVREGYSSFKVFTTYDEVRLDDRALVEVFGVAAAAGAIVMVHAETHELIRWTTERLLTAGKTAPKHHPEARSRIAERDMIERVIAFAEETGASVLIVHVSSAEGAEAIRRARARGLPVYGETCTQYLVFTAECVDRPGFEGAKFCFSPPPRTEADREALWAALADGTLQVLSSDHAPYRYDDPKGKQLHGPDAPFNKIPMGIPGLAARLPLLFSEGVGQGRLTPERFVAVTATNHARLYGLHPQKGTIAIGADADLALWDPEREVTLTLANQHDNMDYTPYEGMTVRGWPVTVIAGGEVVVADDKLVAEPGRGRFLAQGTPGVAR